MRRLPATILAALILTAIGCSGGEKPYAPVPLPVADNLILISIDSLRADRLGAYGYGRPTSPQIDRIARQGVRFANAYSSSNWTVAGHAGMLTGLMPTGHGAMRLTTPIRPDVPLAAERFAAAGFQTAAFVSHLLVSDRYGFKRGFGDFDYEQGASASRVTEKALMWLRRQTPGQRTFLFLHYFDVHTPYGKPGAPMARFADTGCRGPAEVQTILTAAMRGQWERFECFSDLYDADIVPVDREIGRLFDFLRSSKLSDRTTIVITADHGELLGKGEGVIHGLTLYAKELHVPLIVRFPKAAAARTVYDAPVSTIQLASFLLQAAGLEPLAGDLPSLMSVLQGAEPPAWLAADTAAHGYDQIAAIAGNYKLIAPPPYRILGQPLAPLLVDFRKSEQVNLWREQPQLAARLTDLLKNSGWYGQGTCYEVIYRLTKIGFSLQATLPDGVAPVTARAVDRKLNAWDEALLPPGAAPEEAKPAGPVRLVLSPGKGVQGAILVVDPPGALVSLRFPELTGTAKPPLSVAGHAMEWPTEPLELHGPTGPYAPLDDPEGDFVRLRAYPVFHLNRPGAGPAAPAPQLDAEQLNTLKTLGYLGI
jgi:arylsulfatase A-like enzyme